MSTSRETHLPLGTNSYIHTEELIIYHWQETNVAIFTLTYNVYGSIDFSKEIDSSSI